MQPADEGPDQILIPSFPDIIEVDDLDDLDQVVNKFSLPSEEYFRPLEISFGDPVFQQWRWVLIWWALLVTILTLHIPAFVFLVGYDIINLETTMFVTYVSAATGGNTILAIAGTYLMKPFGRIGRTNIH